MASVNLLRKVKDDEGKWVFAPVEFYTNGRIKPAPGTFYLDWRENGKRKRKAVGTDPTLALEEYNRHEHRLALGIPHPDGQPSTDRDLKKCVEEFLDEKKLHAAKKTHSAFRSCLNYFLESCKKSTLESLTRDDLLDLKTFLKQKNLSQRTIYNNWNLLRMFLKSHDIKLAKKGDAPVYVEEDVETFEQEDLDPFFKACTPEEWLMFQFFLCTGMREQEVMHTFIKDINFEASTVRVSAKPQFNWSPKKYKGREIPLPARLLKPLREFIARRKDACPLLFPTSGCKPQDHFLEMCKVIAERAELDKDDFWLHKFRATFATTYLQSGVDLATVQAWMGHTDLASTMRYLKPARGLKVRQKADEVFS